MRYLKKPVLIEARQWFEPGQPGHEPSMLSHRQGNSVNPPDYRQVGDLFLAMPGGPPLGGDSVYMIRTLEGDMRVRNGDWIITGIKGEKYACKPDIFAVTYEACPKRSMICGVDCHPGDAVCNNYCNLAPQKGPMQDHPPAGPDADYSDDTATVAATQP